MRTALPKLKTSSRDDYGMSKKNRLKAKTVPV